MNRTLFSLTTCPHCLQIWSPTPDDPFYECECGLYPLAYSLGNIYCLRLKIENHTIFWLADGTCIVNTNGRSNVVPELPLTITEEQLQLYLTFS